MAGAAKELPVGRYPENQAQTQQSGGQQRRDPQQPLRRLWRFAMKISQFWRECALLFEGWMGCESGYDAAYVHRQLSRWRVASEERSAWSGLWRNGFDEG